MQLLSTLPLLFVWTQCNVYKLLFIVGNATVEGNINSNSELSGAVFDNFTTPGLFSQLPCFFCSYSVSAQQ